MWDLQWGMDANYQKLLQTLESLQGWNFSFRKLLNDWEVTTQQSYGATLKNPESFKGTIQNEDYMERECKEGDHSKFSFFPLELHQTASKKLS